MVRETWVQSRVASYQRLLKWYLIPPCLTLSNIRYISRVECSNPGIGVVPSPTHRCSSYRKERLLVALDYGRQLYFTIHGCFHQRGDVSTLNGCSLKLVDKFTYLGNSVSSTETDINTRLAKAWTAINRLSVIGNSDLTD